MTSVDGLNLKTRSYAALEEPHKRTLPFQPPPEPPLLWA